MIDQELPYKSPDSSIHHNLTDNERNAMRGYLQRAEVRISTLHRIITSFVGGAGLLLLIPVFFKDVVAKIIHVLMNQGFNHYPEFGTTEGRILTVILYLTLTYPLLLSLAIPVYGLYLLLKDIVQFYFTIYTHDLSQDLLSPAFTLGGISFSEDESPTVKREVLKVQYQRASVRYTVPFSMEKRRLYFDEMVEKTHGDIIPPSRREHLLKEKGVLSDDIDEHDVRQFNAALGVARSIDRSLIEEVALQEMLLVRSVMFIRRLVLRYIKILLMFIWTMFITFMMLPLLEDDRFPPLVVFATGYLIWSLAVMRILRTPVRWFYKHRHIENKPHVVDAQLLLFQDGIAKYCNLAIILSIVGLIMAIVGS